MTRFYSDEIPKIFDAGSRVRVGRQIVSVLKVHLGSLKKLTCLDIGCSSGIISNLLSKEFLKVTAIDVDRKALILATKKFKSSKIKFMNVDGSETGFRSNSFDVIVANQVYEFVKDDKKLILEIWRLLKPGGICFFGARNKYAIIEAQYNLPFLSWMPKSVANFFVRLFYPGKHFVGNYRSYLGLKDLVKKFKIHDYTTRILLDPVRYHYKKLAKFKWIFRFLPLEYLSPLIPNYIWILEKI